MSVVGLGLSGNLYSGTCSFTSAVQVNRSTKLKRCVKTKLWKLFDFSWTNNAPADETVFNFPFCKVLWSKTSNLLPEILTNIRGTGDTFLVYSITFETRRQANAHLAFILKLMICPLLDTGKNLCTGNWYFIWSYWLPCTAIRFITSHWWNFVLKYLWLENCDDCRVRPNSAPSHNYMVLLNILFIGYGNTKRSRNYISQNKFYIIAIPLIAATIKVQMFHGILFFFFFSSSHEVIDFFS